MGGAGSGRHGWKPKAEELKKIDVRHLSREGILNSGTSATFHWSDGMGAGFVADVDSFLLTFESVYGQVETKIQKTFMTPNYGGERVFCLCPVCYMRVAILYIHNNQIACASCCNVTWYSRSEIPKDRKLRKARKIRKRLGASISLFEPVVFKPPLMHWKTFDRLREELSLLEADIDAAVCKKFSLPEQGECGRLN